MLERATDLDEFQAGLLELYPDLNDSDFATLMGQALAVAHAGGRLDATTATTSPSIALAAPAPTDAEQQLTEWLMRELAK